MNSKLTTLIHSAQKLASKFKNHEFREFIPRRIGDWVSDIENTVDTDLKEKKIKEVEKMIEVFERQLFIHNSYWSQKSVIDEQD